MTKRVDRVCLVARLHRLASAFAAQYATAFLLIEVDQVGDRFFVAGGNLVGRRVVALGDLGKRSLGTGAGLVRRQHADGAERQAFLGNVASTGWGR